MVARGTVKSRMPSASADSDHRSAESRTPLGGRPARTPASLPSSAEPGASSAPVRTAPGVSAMTRVSARPIRPPAPATIKRISDIFRTSPLRIAGAGSSGNQSGFGLRLRPVVTFDDHKVAFGVGTADRDQASIFRRIVAGERGFIILEFQHHVAGPRGAFPTYKPAAAHQKLRAVFVEYRAVLRDVFLVAVHVVNIDPRDPVTLCHLHFPFLLVKPAPARSRPGCRPPRPWDRRLPARAVRPPDNPRRDRKSTRLNSSHANISYAVFCLKKKKTRTRYHRAAQARLFSLHYAQG